jgi:hypothetical protein
MIIRSGTRRDFLLKIGGGLALTSRGAAAQSIPPDLGLAEWRERMTKFGRRHGEFLAAGKPDDPLDPLLATTYYDAARVFLLIGDYLREPVWATYADAALRVYRDRYVIANRGGVPGYWIFTRGMAMHYARTKDERSAEGVRLLASKAAFARDTSPEASTVSWEQSRETAYALQAKLDAEAVGEPRSPRLAMLVDHALGHIDQWFVSNSAAYTQAFMVALTAEALIRWDSTKPDPRVFPALQKAAAGLWKRMWVPEVQAFNLVDREIPGSSKPVPAPDLNLMIAPLYAWIYHRTGNRVYRDRAAVIFAHGVRKAYLAGGKQFNQNYRWSFDYLDWMTKPPLA